MVVQRVSVEVVYLRQMFRVGNERLSYQTMRVVFGVDSFLHELCLLVAFSCDRGAENQFRLAFKTQHPSMVRDHVVGIFFDKSPIFHT